jgi:Glycosyltransferases involved in cell wall biogenesis
MRNLLPEVTVVVPLFNRADIVGETVQSVIAQDMPSWQLIIVDDGSTDNSLDVGNSFAAGDSRIRCVSRPLEMPKGANSCRNYGFSLADGKFIKWLDSDDLLTADALSSQLEVFRQRPGLNVCFGQGEYFISDTGLPDGLWSRKVSSDNMLWDYLRNQIRWPVGGPLWRKSFFSGYPFHENLMNSQEWLMHALQIMKLQPEEYAILDKVVYKIRRGNLRMSSQSNRTSKYFYNEFKARTIVWQHLPKGTSVRIRSELLKQMGIYFFHYVKGRKS